MKTNNTRPTTATADPPSASTSLALPGGEAITITLEHISPETAAEYLKHNVKNRKPRPRQVEILKRDMVADAWRLTHQGIAFGESGALGHSPLLDGQHRLLAIVASGRTIPCLVFRGLPDNAQETTDMGQARSLAENLQLYDGEKNVNVLVALVNATAQCWARYDARVSLPQTREILKLFPKLRLLAMINTTKYPAPFRMTPVIAACAIAVHKWPQDAASFHDSYQQGLHLHAEHPAHHLRNYCLSLEDNNKLGVRQKIFSFAADCLQHHIECRSMASAKPTGTGLPWLRTALESKYAQLRAILRLV